MEGFENNTKKEQENQDKEIMRKIKGCKRKGRERKKEMTEAREGKVMIETRDSQIYK